MSHKKITDPEGEMEKLMNRAVAAAKAPFNDSRDPALPSLRSVADSLGTTVIRARKLLITANYFSSPTATTIQRMHAEGKTIEEISEALKLKTAAVNAYLPYDNLAYNLPQTSSNADRHKRYRATHALRRVVDKKPHDEKLISDALWKTIIIFQGYPFTTSGRGSREGTTYTYEVSKKGSTGGRHYSGASVGEFGNELFIVVDGEKKERSISRSTVDLAFKKYMEVMERDGTVTGPKKLGVFGSSYLLLLFRRFVP